MKDISVTIRFDNIEQLRQFAEMVDKIKFDAEISETIWINYEHYQNEIEGTKLLGK